MLWDEGRVANGCVERGLLVEWVAMTRSDPSKPTSMAFLDALLRAVPAFIARVDENFCLRYMNQTVSGFDQVEVIGRSIFEFTLPDYHDVARSAIRQCIEAGRVVRYDVEG